MPKWQFSWIQFESALTLKIPLLPSKEKIIVEALHSFQAIDEGEQSTCKRQAQNFGETHANLLPSIWKSLGEMKNRTQIDSLI